ncbi:hypothetical protein ZORO111903_19310 [Zobellia roscoffensis]
MDLTKKHLFLTKHILKKEKAYQKAPSDVTY